MKKMVPVLLALILVLCSGIAAAESGGLLGLPYPDFTVTDTEGNTFTLSEELKTHEAVLINSWATWCPPCRGEFPALDKVYEKYRDRVSFIALSCEDADSMEVIGEFRRASGLSLPMGRDEGSRLYSLTGASGIPTTVVVDRFGNAVYLRTGAFSGESEISRLLDALLGDGYTESTVLDEIPRDTSTRAFPVSSSRAVHVLNENAKHVLFSSADDDADPLLAYVIEGDTASLRLEIAPSDNPGSMAWYNATAQELTEFSSLLDPEKNACIVEMALPGEQSQYHYACGCLGDTADAQDPDVVELYVIPGEQYIEEFADLLRQSGYEGVTWKYVEAEEANVETAPEAYVLYIRDQDGVPVPGVNVSFCTDVSCAMAESGSDGVVTFEGEPADYHVQVVEVPDGYGFDGDYSLYTGPAYGEWVLRIRKIQP